MSFNFLIRPCELHFTDITGWKSDAFEQVVNKLNNKFFHVFLD